MIHYRKFRNTDPPNLVEVWNETFTGRGAVRLRGSAMLEHYVLAKPYFDPEGLIVAERDHQCVGFAHAGFGTGTSRQELSPQTGVICLIGVRPGFRRRGIGTELLRRCEAYLRERGARTILAGPHTPCNPFYLGLYGGSDLPGFLASDADAEPFLTRRGYEVGDRIQVLQRALSDPIRMVDPRFSHLRQAYDLRVATCRDLGCWWQECVLSPVEPLEFFLEARGSGQRAAWALVWEMEAFSSRWHYPAVGILDCTVPPESRRRGLAKFLVAQLLRHLQEQYFEITEVQVPETNAAAAGLFRNLGFAPVDEGRIYRQQHAAAAQ